MYNLVGFQTNLKFGEQKRVFSMIPALKKRGIPALRRDAPQYLSRFSAAVKRGLLYAQETGFVLCRADHRRGGLYGISRFRRLAGLNAARRLRGQDPLVLPRETMLGALAGYISDPSVKNFSRWEQISAYCRRWKGRFVRKGRDMNRFLPGHWKLFPPGCGRKASINKTA